MLRMHEKSRGKVFDCEGSLGVSKFDNLTLDEVEHVLERWKLYGPQGD